MRTPMSEIAAVRMSALIGSPFFVVTEKRLRNGITPSEAMACNSRGAPGGADTTGYTDSNKVPLVSHIRS